MRQVCHCGHDAATHFLDLATGARASCLAVFGCECLAYVDENDPKPEKKVPRRVGHISSCQCHDCKAYAAQNPSYPKVNSTWPP